MSQTNIPTKKVVVYVFLFPPIALLIFVALSYFSLLYLQKKNAQDIIESEKTYVTTLFKNHLEEKALLVNYLIKKTPEKTIDVIELSQRKNENIAIFKNNKLIYVSNKKYLPLLLNFKNKDGWYEKQNIIAYFHSCKNGFKVITFIEKEVIDNYINRVTHIITKNNYAVLKEGVLWIIVAWFILTAISLYISMVVYNKLKSYEATIKRSNEQIIFQSRKAILGDLLPMIAHQWRQPINKIASVLMRMRFELAKPTPSIETLDSQCQTIENSVELMSNTIDDFRSFYRPKEEKEEVDLSVIIRKAIYFLDELLEKKKIKIVTNLKSVKATIHANEFLQVLLNLIKNAADAVDKYGEIYISLEDIEKAIEVRVEDNGTGIPEDKLEKIFEAHESTKEASMGLGLYMSKLIIEGHMKGTIKAYNTSRGAGFVIVLPKN